MSIFMVEMPFPPPDAALIPLGNKENCERDTPFQTEESSLFNVGQPAHVTPTPL